MASHLPPPIYIFIIYIYIYNIFHHHHSSSFIITHSLSYSHSFIIISPLSLSLRNEAKSIHSKNSIGCFLTRSRNLPPLFHFVISTHTLYIIQNDQDTSRISTQLPQQQQICLLESTLKNSLPRQTTLLRPEKGFWRATNRRVRFRVGTSLYLSPYILCVYICRLGYVAMVWTIML